jgi:diacylglycerol kinase (ATP)
MDQRPPTPAPHNAGERAKRAVAEPAEESPFKSEGGFKRILGALVYSWAGLRIAIQVESAFRQELLLAAILTVVLFALPFSAFERLLLAGSIVLVLIVELMNSAVEAAIDRISFDNHHLSKRAKDLGSAAVFLSLSYCAACWLVLGLPVLLRLIG